MLGGGNPLTCGVGIVIEVIRKNNSDYDPEGVDMNATPSSRDPIYLGNLLRLFAQHVPDFMNLIMNAPAQKQRTSSTFGDEIEPLGFDRFKTCELMAELLHCSNMVLLNEVGSEEFIAARDAQRHRLRAEGKLLPVSLNEAPSSAEDASLPISHPSTADESRRLEVTNTSVDDDGFEEVSHTADEESSHGVLELPDAPTNPSASSLVDKDDDDFVDEPLSSPRLNPREAGGDRAEQQSHFEDPDLVIAPLSPSKKPSQASTSEEAAKGSASAKAAEEAASPDAQPQRTEKREEEQGAESSKPSEGDQSGGSTTPSTSPAPEPPSEKDISPDLKDLPAPLFSRDVAPSPPPDASAGPSETGSTPAQEQETTPKAPETAAETSIPAPEPPQVDDTSAAQATQESGDTSTAGAGRSEESSPAADAPANSKPVVGDYLKMQLVEHRVVPTILSFFFRYPWNNFLHNVVYDIVQQVFNGPMDRGYNPTLAVSLFETADITNQIINGQRASEKSEAESKTRMGYMGHLTLIAEEVVKFTERHPPAMLSEIVLEKVMAQDWINYVEGALAETRERDSAILGGVRPEVAMNNRASVSGLMGPGFSGLSSIGLGGGSSSALADAGLNGGSALAEGVAGSGVGPFAISAGTLMSGFGSSSDEDDDEEQETEEDVNNEVGDFDSFDDWFPSYDTAGPSGRTSSLQLGRMDSPEPEVEYVGLARASVSEPAVGTGTLGEEEAMPIAQLLEQGPSPSGTRDPMDRAATPRSFSFAGSQSRNDDAGIAQDGNDVGEPDFDLLEPWG